jgi:aryl-alcohol dehydrogenase-like predicted oxidoreductase
MKYNLLGNTGLLVSELCLGTMTFGGKGRFAQIGQLEQDAVNQLVKASVDAGINFIDTANVYSEGLSEELTGKSIKQLGLNRDDLVIATKVRGSMGEGINQVGLTRKHIMQQVEESLKRLEIDYIDLYQMHSYDPMTPIEETIRTFETLVQSGKVRYIGCSNVAAWQLMKALSFSEYNDLSKFVSLQAYYTIAGRDLEREIVPLLLDQKVGLLVWSPLAGGLLSGKYGRNIEGPEGSRRKTFDFPPVDMHKAYDVLDALHPMAKEKGISVAQLSLAWLLHQKVVTSVIIGAKDVDQLNDNIKSVDVVLSEDDLKKLDDVSKMAPEYPGWMLEFTVGNRKV